MKILHIVFGLPIGGAEVLLEIICRRVDKQKYDIYVCSITDEGLLGSKIHETGVKLITLNSSLRVYSLATIVKLFLLIRKIDPVIVQTHMFQANTLGRIASFLANVPVIIATEHGFYRYKKKRQIVIDWLLSHITDKIIVISEAVKNYISLRSKIPQNKFKVVYNFIDIEAFVPKRDKNELRKEFGISALDFVIGSVGRIVKEKGYDILLNAMSLLKGRGYSFKYIIVGDGKYLSTLKANACATDLSEDVIFTGFRSDIADILQLFDIFTLPTLDEGFGISIIEAQTMGLPIIASSVDAIPEIIQNGYNGLLIPPNDPMALANGIEYLFKNAGRRSEIGGKARESVVERFSTSVGIKNLDDLYTQLTHKRNPLTAFKQSVS